MKFNTDILDSFLLQMQLMGACAQRFFLLQNSQLTREDPQLCQADFFQIWLIRMTIFSNEMGYT